MLSQQCIVFRNSRPTNATAISIIYVASQVALEALVGHALSFKYYIIYILFL